MRKRSIYTIPVAALAVITMGLTTGAMLPDEITGVAAPTPTASAPFTLPPVLAAAVQCEEDEPCWDCESMGNLICGGTELTEAQKSDAWALWESAGGAAELLVNPHAKVTVTGYTLTDPYKQGLPELDIQQLALHGGDIWYIFTAEAI